MIRSAGQTAIDGNRIVRWLDPAPTNSFLCPIFLETNGPLLCCSIVDEVATALFLANGHLGKAADLLKVNESQIKRMVRKSPRLRTLLVRLAEPE